jgi:asparagine synthase (glutamine-hydrolysing)
MCGIMGKVGKPLVTHMPVGALRHRGPDAQCQWTNGTTCTLGHTRLAIIDLDPRANQPMHDPSGRYTLVFNGEIYNYVELAKEHLTDVAFVSSSDSEVLLHLWARFGVRCLSMLRGMFAFAIWDEQEQSLWLARDRLGKKPIFYSFDQNSLAFASELCALCPLLPVPPKISLASLDLFLGYQFIPAPHSIYENVHKLPAAHYGVWRRGQWQVERYWQLQFEPSRRLAEEEVLEQLDAKLREAVRLRLRADVPVGVLLSGGVDSSLVTAIAAQEHRRPIKTFSVGFAEESFNELPYADKIARRYNTEHYPVILRERLEEQFAHMVAAYGEPFGDKSALASLFVCREAAKHVKVILNGDGGDELLAGYSKYQYPLAKQVFARRQLGGYRMATQLETLAYQFPEKSPLFNLLQSGSYWMQPLLQVLRFEGFVRNFDRDRLYREPIAKAVKTVRQEYEMSLLRELSLPRNLLSQLLSVDYRNYLANDLLVKMDIASMAASLEARSPLLDHELMEFTARLETDLKIRNGTSKYLLKKLAGRYIPAEVINRPKHGFSIPVSQWIRTFFAGSLRDMIANKNHPLWEYCRTETVQQWLDRHVLAQEEHGYRLWMLLILGTWLQQSLAA